MKSSIPLRYNTATNITIELPDGTVRRSIIIDNAWAAPTIAEISEGDRIAYRGWMMGCAETIELSYIQKI